MFILHLSALICPFRVLLESVLRPLYEKMKRAGEDQMQVVRVRRRHIWSDALSAFSKADFHTLLVKRQLIWVVRGVGMGKPMSEPYIGHMTKMDQSEGVIFTFRSSAIAISEWAPENEFRPQRRRREDTKGKIQIFLMKSYKIYIFTRRFPWKMETDSEK